MQQRGRMKERDEGSKRMTTCGEDITAMKNRKYLKEREQGKNAVQAEK